MTPTVPERTTKRADELVIGDVVADDLYDEPHPVLSAHRFVDCGAEAVLAVFRATDGTAYSREFDAAATVPVESAPEPTGYQVLAADLRKVADRLDLAGHVDMSKHQYVRLNIQPRGANDEQTIERTDALGLVLFDRPGQPEAMGDGSYHYDVEGRFGCVAVHLYSGISTETVRMREAAAQAAADAAELARLRAEVARLEARVVGPPTQADIDAAKFSDDPLVRAAAQAYEDADDDPTGLTYSREDDDPQVIRPTSPRMPMHVGVREADGGELVDETPDEAPTLWAAIRFSDTRREAGRLIGRTTPEQLRAATLDLLHGQALDEDADHARRADVREGEQGRITTPDLAQFLAKKEDARRDSGPVTVHFSFGHGQTDPDTGKDLVDHYVTIVGPSHEACRAAMFASKYGAGWAFDYLKDDPESDKWIARWTEHERIVVDAAVVDELLHYRGVDDRDQVACGVSIDDIDSFTTRPGSATCPACIATMAPVVDPTGRGRESDPDWVAGFGPVPGSDLIGESR